MLSPIVEISKLENSGANISDVWQVSKLCLKLGRLNQSLTIAYSVVHQDATQQQVYKQHYIEAVKLGAEFAEEIGDNPRAAYYWEQLTQQVPSMVVAWHGLGIAKANLQDLAGAEVALNQALQLEPGNQKIRAHLIEVQKLLSRR